MRWPLVFIAACGASPSSRTPTNAPMIAKTISAAPIASQSEAAPQSAAAPPQSQEEPNAALFSMFDDDSSNYTRRPAGFSQDDAYLGYAISTCDPCPLEFHFESPTKPALTLAYYYQPGAHDDVAEKRTNAEVDRKLKEMGVIDASASRKARGPFPYPDLIFASHVDPAPALGKITVRFGARVAGYAPVFPLKADLGPMPLWNDISKPMQAAIARLPQSERQRAIDEHNASYTMTGAEIVYANVTHDGSELGVAAIGTGVMWWETGVVMRTKTRAFVAQVYNDTAMRFQQAKDYKKAAELFAKAEAAQPSESLFSYNLACAYARGGDARAKDALARAIKSGGASIKARAKTDADFERVRQETWFIEATR